MCRVVLLTLAVLVCLELVQGYGSGAPKGACDDMVPQHHTPAKDKSSFPYIVTADKKTVRPGETVTLTIVPNPKQQDSAALVKDFQGFLVQARVGNTPVGKFQSQTGVVKVIDCGSGKENAATHSGKSVKNKVSIKWTAPPSLSEKVQFYSTVAKNGGEFWVKVEGPVVSVRK